MSRVYWKISREIANVNDTIVRMLVYIHYFVGSIVTIIIFSCKKKRMIKNFSYFLFQICTMIVLSGITKDKRVRVFRFTVYKMSSTLGNLDNYQYL